MRVPSQIHDFIRRGALFVIADSGGKDSQAMKIVLHRLVPADQLVIVHCDMHGMEWPGTEEHVRRYSMGLSVHIAQARASLLDRVQERHAMLRAKGLDISPWPSPKQRWCTSDLKRGPMEKVVRRLSKETGRKLIVDCWGERAEESAERAKRPDLHRNARQSIAGRDWWIWLPIKDMTEAEVFSTIAGAGQEPHWIYQHMRRCSCAFCIYATEQDHATAAPLHPDLYSRYSAVERSTGKTLVMPTKKHGARTLEQITGVAPRIAERAA